MTTPQPIIETENPLAINYCLQDLSGAAQQLAVFKFMLHKPHSYTHVIARGAGCINVPDCVANIKIKIERHGLAIHHYLPKERHVNRHGQIMAVHRWLIVQREAKRVAA